MGLRETYDQFTKVLLRECRESYKDRLISFCLFGSTARGTMNNASDVDFLLVVDPLPIGRMKRVDEFAIVESRLKPAMSELRRNGIYVELSPLFKTPEEVEAGSLMFLDMLEEGKILFDRNDFLKAYFSGWRKKLEAQGARRVKKGEAWYWILKEPYTAGEEFEI